ncbi:MAG: alpha/beta hydrolase [Deltaproteobacteria bacterium]|nr:alpha/beta hydrolase [Deltaproteobacteria bacterium]MBW2394169.1 alpha/beta hydrolase [Deltaproteobacteria bacterium]
MQTAASLLAQAAQRSIVLPDRGVELALLDWGGEGPIALLHHANGFCKGMWAQVAEGLRADYRVVAIDARGQGDSPRPAGDPADVYAWDEFALDLVAVAEQLLAESGDPQIAVGIGHSFGGTSMLGAASRRPELFGRLVLVDPVTPPPPDQEPPERPAHLNDLVGRALKRRADWPSVEEAREWWAERDFFAAWQPEALDLYALDGLRERADGSVELKCSPEVEAAVFNQSRGIDVRALARHTQTPCLWLWAKGGNFPLPFHQALVATMPEARLEEVDAGHLVPMERPELIVEAVRGFVAGPEGS